MFKHATEAWSDATERRETPTSRTPGKGKILDYPVDGFQFQLDFQLLISAGSDTSRNALSEGMLRLMERPSIRQEILDDPSLLPGAIEEVLRFSPRWWPCDATSPRTRR